MAGGFLAYNVNAQEKPKTEETKNENENKGYSETYRYLNLFGDVFERVRTQYVEEVEDKELIEYAVNGMLSSLDPHSSYLNEERYNEMKVETRGQFGGLGIEVTMENGLVKVVSPIDDTPAFRAGILAGDYIVKIDGEAVMGLTLSDAVKLMRGKVGTTIDLEIHRENMDAPISVTLTRDVINIKSVRHRVEGNAGYIRITQFSSNTEEGLRSAIDDVKKQLGDKLIGFVIDLRNNPGGLLDQAIAVSDAFLDTGEIVSTRGRHEDDTKRDNATPGDIANGLPLVVLINSGSASASEIVSGALQDHKRAILLGTKSFGKGSVQTVIPLPGYGAMRLTTARYYTPSGRSIQATGIEPDIFVEQAHVEAFKSSYNRIREEDLHGALDKNNAKNNDKNNEKTDEKPVKGPANDNQEPEEMQDYQLMRAFDLLSGLSLYKKPVDAKTGETAP
ncbi:MAG: S41 family peptidase [Alphaproteobacteria bacterium]|nr:S41 family peptidase [Alphaproteobacteria bacterium]MCB9974630.1 S41 family peptidase [Rhodospirillales bacterium]